jgi:hypothetical protein
LYLETLPHACVQKKICALVDSLSVVLRLFVTTLLWACFYEV